jgi:hypothetical protein
LCFIIYLSPASYLSVISVGYCFVAWSALLGWSYDRLLFCCLLGWSYDAVAFTQLLNCLLTRKKRKEATLEEKTHIDFIVQSRKKVKYF